MANWDKSPGLAHSRFDAERVPLRVNPLPLSLSFCDHVFIISPDSSLSLFCSFAAAKIKFVYLCAGDGQAATENRPPTPPSKTERVCRKRL